MVNSLVFTRLGHDVNIIIEALDELEEIGLIIRYNVNGETYLNYPDFQEKQNKLNPSKEGKPEIPDINSCQTPDELQSNSEVAPSENKTSKEKVSKTKPQISDQSSVHFSEKNEGYVEKIENEGFLIEKLKMKKELGNINIWQIIQEYTNKNTHPQAIYEALRALRGAWDGISSSYQGYFRNVIAKYNAKHNERERARECQVFKDELLKAPKSVLNLTKGIGS